MIVTKATAQDNEDVWIWRNDPQTRVMFTNQDEVSWNTHNDWFEKTLSNPNCYLYIGRISETEKAGVCRFDVNNNLAEVSINLNPEMRGRNLSYQLLTAAINIFWITQRICLEAKIKKQNIASIKCFTKCGFVIEREDEEYNYYLLKPKQTTS